MFVLAHLSDLHLALRPRLLELAGKRGLGYINWHRGRKYIHRRETLDAITRDVKASAPDHIAVTGDLVNLSLPIEYAAARALLETLGPPHDVTVIPGNHDAYVPATLGGPEKAWGDYMRGDDGATAGTFPFVRRRNGVALIALSSGLPTGPFMATGTRRRRAAFPFCGGARCDERIVPRRTHPSSAAQPAEPPLAAPDRRRGISPGAGRARRRSRAAWPRSLPRDHLARRAG